MHDYLEELKNLSLKNIDNPYLNKGYELVFEDMLSEGRSLRTIENVTLEFTQEYKITYKFRDILTACDILWFLVIDGRYSYELNGLEFCLSDNIIDLVQSLYRLSENTNVIKITPIIPVYGDLLKRTLIYVVDANHSDKYFRDLALKGWK